MISGFPAANYDYCIQKNSQNLQAITIKLVKSSLATREVWNNHEVTVAEPKS